MTKHPRTPELFELQQTASRVGLPLLERLTAARLVIEIRTAEGLPLETRPTWARNGVRHVATQRPWPTLLERLESFVV